MSLLGKKFPGLLGMLFSDRKMSPIAREALRLDSID
jgi:hypothetical protein